MLLQTPLWSGKSSVKALQPRQCARPGIQRATRPGPCCSYDYDVLERQRNTPDSAPLVRSPPPPPPPPPPSKASGDSRRNLIAGMFAVVGVAVGYQLSQGDGQNIVRSNAPVGPGRRRRTWVYADAGGTYDEKTALEKNRRPLLRVAGDTVEVLRSDGYFMRMHVSQRDARQIIMEGNMGEFYTLSPAAGKVDPRNVRSLLQYFSDPRWELGMRRSPVPAN